MEVQFLQLQFVRVSELFERMAATRQFTAEDPNDCHILPFQLVAVESETIDDLVTRILRMKRQLTETPDDLTFQEGAMALHDLSLRLPYHMSSQQILIATWATKLYRMLARKSPEFLPWLAHTMVNLARYHIDSQDYEKAVTVAEEACKMWDIVLQSYPDQDYRSASVYAKATLGLCLVRAYRYADAFEILRPAADIYRSLMEHLDDEDSIFDDAQKASIRMRHQWCFDDLADCLNNLNRPMEALKAVEDSLRDLKKEGVTSSISTIETRMNRALSTLYRDEKLHFIDVQRILDTTRLLGNKFDDAKKLYTNTLQRFALVCLDGVDLTGRVWVPKDIYGQIQNPFDGDPSWLTRNFSDEKQVPRLLMEYFSSRSIPMQEVLFDLLSIFLQTDTYMLMADYALIGLLVSTLR